jgi:hypothetical protein
MFTIDQNRVSDAMLDIYKVFEHIAMLSIGIW